MAHLACAPSVGDDTSQLTLSNARMSLLKCTALSVKPSLGRQGITGRMGILLGTAGLVAIGLGGLSLILVSLSLIIKVV
jgi:hypothetical protein